ncbi:MAG: efflux RND transporter periplasmic adaptor subunit [Candidatus Riflebacteria bacterium]|nr:efflux RND transporter periplasmic adaptor subunit [Candidatus Riflebacteria bacterium]
MESLLILGAAALCLSCPALGSGDHHHRSEAFTAWTTRADIFMEYVQPVARKEARFTIHLTELKEFRPIAKGTVTIRLVKGGSPPVEGKVDRCTRAGIFHPTVTPPEPGDYRAEVLVTGQELVESFPVGTIRVLAAGESPPPAPEESPGGDLVPFLKEQQWTIPFRTVVAAQRELNDAVHVLGEIKAKPGCRVEVTSPAEGRVMSTPPTLGHRVHAGDTLAEIAPFLAPEVDRPQVEQEVKQAQAELTLAAATLLRTQGLVEKGAMPEKELSAARTQHAIAGAKLQSASQRREAFVGTQQHTSGGAGADRHFRVRAPIGGLVTRIEFTNDQQVTRDRFLMELTDLRRVWIELRVFEPDLPLVRQSIGAVFTLPGFEKSFDLGQLSGKVVHVGPCLEPASRTAPIVYEVTNPEERFPIGGFVEAEILTRRSGRYLSVPIEALMEDGNRNVLFVHVSGEAFERRYVVTGVRDRGYVAILEGLKPGERVVTTGAYEILLSTKSAAIPQHGHAH